MNKRISCGGGGGGGGGYACIPRKDLRFLNVEYAERRIKYGILFLFSPFYDYSNLE